MKIIDLQAANDALSAQLLMAHRMAMEEYLAKSAEDAVALVATAVLRTESLKVTSIISGLVFGGLKK